MTISSLQDLNTYSLTPITYNDVRPARVTFDRGTTVPQSLTISENNTYEFPYGINIEDITQFDVALVEYIIDLSNHPVPVNVTWNFLPAHVTVSRTNNIFTVSNIRSRQDWLFVRLAQAQPPFGFSGQITHTGSLTFFADSAAETRTVASWTVSLTVIEIEYFSAAPDLTYVANEVKSNFATTSIIAEADEFDPVWTLRIAASDPVIDQITADAGTWNNLTKEFVVTGSTAVCNSALSSLSIEFLRSDKNFNLFFILANNFTASIETQIQAFESRDFISDNNITSGFVAEIDGIIRGGIASLTAQMIFDVEESVILALVRFSSTVLSNTSQTVNETNSSFSITLNTNTSVTAFNDSVAADLQLVFDLSACDVGTTISWASTPSGVIITNVNEVYTVSNINTIAEFDAMKNPTVEFPASTFNDQVIDVAIQFNNSNGSNFEFGYSNITVINQFLTNREVSRGYVGNNVTTNIFASPLLSIEQNVNDVYTLTLTVSSGELEQNDVFESTKTFTGTGTNINQLLLQTNYYALKNSNTNHQLTITLIKDSITLVNVNSVLNFTANSPITEEIYTFNFTSVGNTQIWTPSDLQSRYQNINVLVVAGGGGSSGTRLDSGGVRFSGTAGGGGGEVFQVNGISITNVPQLNVIVGNGGLNGNGTFNSGSAGGTSEISGNNFTTISSRGGFPGQLLSITSDQPTVYFPGGEARLEGGQAGTTSNNFYGSFRGSQNTFGVGGGGSDGTSHVGQDRTRILGGPPTTSTISGVFTAFASGGNGTNSDALVPYVSTSGTENLFGSGGGAAHGGNTGPNDLVNGNPGIVIIKTVNP